MSGGNGGGDTRVPIPNTTVKPSSADGTWTAGSWESRTLPGNSEDRCQKLEVRLERICLKCKFEQESDIRPLISDVWEYSSLAQLVEHSAVNRVVAGSSPARGAMLP